MICRSKLNMCMFFVCLFVCLFYQISRILLSFLQRNFIYWSKTVYIEVRNIYRTNWFTILESEFTDNLEFFWSKKKYNIGYILCDDITSERSKIWKSPAV